MLASTSIPLPAEWNLDPTIFLGTALLCGAYLYAVGPLRKRYGWGPEVKRGQIAAFLIGTAVMLLALVSPLDELGDEYLFSAHMVQHLLITVVAPPLWLLGTPGWLVRVLLRQPVIGRVLPILTKPPVAFSLFNGIFALWHIPALYNLTLDNESIHVLEHLLFMSTAVLNWWPILNPLPEELPHMTFGSQMLYLFANCQVMVVLGVLLFFTGPLYEPYLLAPRILGISAADDQTIGALIMWIPGTIVYLIAMSFAFYAWFEQHEGEEDALGAEQLP
jgi:cytochrome c oxidase assembly factor CtaG